MDPYSGEVGDELGVRGEEGVDLRCRGRRRSVEAEEEEAGRLAPTRIHGSEGTKTMLETRSTNSRSKTATELGEIHRNHPAAIEEQGSSKVVMAAAAGEGGEGNGT